MKLPPSIPPSFFRRTLVLTFLAHGEAMLGMLAFLLPLLPGGGTDDDMTRIQLIAAHPVGWRLGWAGWQLTALSDIAFAAGLFMLTAPKSRARRYAIISAAFTFLAVIPDQAAQALLDTRGYNLAVDAANYHDATDYLAFEHDVFPLTSGWGACLYTFGAIGWAFTLRELGMWSRWLTRLTIPMLTLFLAISIAPLIPNGPSPKLIGMGNALAFTLLEGWFVLVFYSKATLATSSPK